MAEGDDVTKGRKKELLACSAALAGMLLMGGAGVICAVHGKVLWLALTPTDLFFGAIGLGVMSLFVALSGGVGLLVFYDLYFRVRDEQDQQRPRTSLRLVYSRKGVSPRAPNTHLRLVA
ncbi:MAG: hypothetical protein Q7T01_02905 [bacterium]|nr:hypothetical protein [bacterium]